jgi:hypothetical protein
MTVQAMSAFVNVALNVAVSIIHSLLIMLMAGKAGKNREVIRVGVALIA